LPIHDGYENRRGIAGSSFDRARTIVEVGPFPRRGSCSFGLSNSWYLIMRCVSQQVCPSALLKILEHCGIMALWGANYRPTSHHFTSQTGHESKVRPLDRNIPHW
jgi:hypothetical protein